MDELIAMQFVQETKDGRTAASASRRRPLSINPDGAFSLGFHVDVGHMSAIAINLAGDVLDREDRPLDDLEPDHAVIELDRAAQAADGGDEDSARTGSSASALRRPALSRSPG